MYYPFPQHMLPGTEGGWAALRCPWLMMKKRLIAGFVLLLAMVCLCAHALADDPIKVSIELSEYKFAEPKDIAVTIKVTNTGTTDMPGGVQLYYPNGKQIEDFGEPTLTAGQSKDYSFTWSVTQANLESGRLVFPVKYLMYNESGELINKTKNFTVLFTYTGAVASVEINRVITPTTAGKGQEVSVTYDVVNSGNIDITDITIKEHSSISSKTGTIDAIAAGEKASYTFTVKMGTKDLTSQATITYKANGKTQTEKKDAATISYGEVNLTGTLSADKKGGIVGDAVTVTLQLKNTGKVDYTNVTVADPALGEIFAGQTVKAGETVKLEKTISIAATQDYQFTITAQDPDGNTVETASDRLTLTAVDPSQKIALVVNAAADQETVYEIPGDVRFTISVTNQGAVDVSNVTVYAVDTALYTFDKIAAGETKTFVRDVAISMAGQFQFVAKCKNQLNETAEFASNILPITFSTPTAEPTEAPLITPEPPVYATKPVTADVPEYFGTIENVLDIAKWVLAGLGGVCLLLFAVGAVAHAKMKRNAAKVVDQLEGGAYRDYYDRPRNRKTREVQPAEQAENPIADEEPGDVMAETLAKLYPDREAEKPEVVIEENETDAQTEQPEQADAADNA